MPIHSPAAGRPTSSSSVMEALKKLEAVDNLNLPKEGGDYQKRIKARRSLRTALREATGREAFFSEVVQHMRDLSLAKQVAFFLVNGDKTQLKAVSDVREFTRTAPEVRDLEKAAQKALTNAGQSAGDGRPFFLLRLQENNRPWAILMLDVRSPSTSFQVDVLLHLITQEWCGFLGRKAMGKQKPIRFWPSIAAFALLAAALIPVPMNILLPAQVVPINRLPVTAPFRGIVEQLHVRSNQVVAGGDVLVTFRADELKNEQEIALAKRDLSLAKLRRIEQSAGSLSSPSLKEVRLGLELAELELKFVEEKLARAQVTAVTGGQILLQDEHVWNERSVAHGEQIMTIVQTEKSQLRVDADGASLSSIREGAEAIFYPSGNPLETVKAKVSTTLFFAASDVNDLSHHHTEIPVFLEIESTELPLGTSGAVQIFDGTQQPLILYVLRQPLSWARQWLGI